MQNSSTTQNNEQYLNQIFINIFDENQTKFATTHPHITPHQPRTRTHHTLRSALASSEEEAVALAKEETGSPRLGTWQPIISVTRDFMLF